MVNAKQIKMARVLLDWNQSELAQATGFSVPAINNIERGASQPRESTMRKIVEVLEARGVEFTPRGGVCRRSDIVQVFEGEGSINSFFDDIYVTMKNLGGGEILINGVDVQTYLDADQEACAIQFDRLDRLGTVTQKVLCRRGTTHFNVPYAEYRWLEDEVFSSTPFYVYGDKLAVILWGDPVYTMVFHHERLAEAYAKQFRSLWKNAITPDIESKGKGRG